MKYLTKSFDYNLPGSGEITLTIVFGDEQQGTSTLKKFNGKYVIGEVKDESLGDAADIKNKSLLITSTVTDINSKTDWTSITYQINGSDAETFKEETDSPND